MTSFTAFHKTVAEAQKKGREPDYWEIPDNWVEALIEANSAYIAPYQRMKETEVVLGIPVHRVSNSKPAKLVLKPISDDAISLQD